ncbi:MAG: TPM domain-containing protein [Hydrotalea flava]|uniref:TPM domain-containing protein n=1 Tax=Hydrotalea sp. AMD TaxID=2501297 RepID=UPI000943D89C|nr:TPM domain-containing protein [Hydrotalea sp. AMD]MBY0348214.1 TPM domain-containing protein [Hydrotalea flava]NIM34878.1 TPM domain-containing protein [Hydrotalea flava]NIM37708.1 TPM domain-containing protein [Hydrotalea flava]NIN02873.1 TPM domain-containing protein [Hydrotalea flava]NIN14558.1 TPM domain-containing protein [Hydrotalea flava]
MKKLILISILLLQTFFCLAQDILPKPNPPRLVNDYAGVLSAEQNAALEQKLVALDDSTSNQIAIVLVKTLNGYDVADYANKLFRAWGIGNKKTNNGILILAAIDDRKVWIEIGYGLEGAIPDATTSQIYRDEIVPAFRNKDYYTGLNNAVDDLAKAAVGEYKVARKQDKPTGSGAIIFIILLLIVFFILRRGGGGGGGGGLIAPILLSGMLNNRSSGSWGGSGGGFGGFGGGSSGGGGAGGGW